MCQSNGNGHGGSPGKTDRSGSNLGNKLHGWGTDRSATRRQNGHGSHGGDTSDPGVKPKPTNPWGW